MDLSGKEICSDWKTSIWENRSKKQVEGRKYPSWKMEFLTKTFLPSTKETKKHRPNQWVSKKVHTPIMKSWWNREKNNPITSQSSKSQSCFKNPQKSNKHNTTTCKSKSPSIKSSNSTNSKWSVYKTKTTSLEIPDKLLKKTISLYQTIIMPYKSDLIILNSFSSKIRMERRISIRSIWTII